MSKRQNLLQEQGGQNSDGSKGTGSAGDQGSNQGSNQGGENSFAKKGGKSSK